MLTGAMQAGRPGWTHHGKPTGGEMFALAGAVASSSWSWVVYVGIAALVFAETAALVGLVIPSESVLVVAGVLALKGHLNVTTLFAVAFLAAVAGDVVGFASGRRIGPRIEHGRIGRWIGPQRWDRARDLLSRRGAVTVVLGRLVGFLRSVVPSAAGMTGMPFARFAIADVVGCTLWTAGVGLLAWAANGSIEEATELVSNAGLIALAVVAVMAMGWWLGRRWAFVVRLPHRHPAEPPH